MPRILRILLLLAVLGVAYLALHGETVRPEPEESVSTVTPTAPLENYAHRVVVSVFPEVKLVMHHGRADTGQYWLYYRPIPNVDPATLSEMLEEHGLSVDRSVGGDQWFVSAVGEYNGSSISLQFYVSEEKNALVVFVSPRTS